jgi:hypothetical protein
MRNSPERLQDRRDVRRGAGQEHATWFAQRQTELCQRESATTLRDAFGVVIKQVCEDSMKVEEGRRHDCSVV